MMKLLTALLALTLSLPSAQALGQLTAATPEPAPSSLVKRAEPDERTLQSHDHYRNKDGQTVHSPARAVQDQIPNGASARCRDGTYSFSQHRRGTCSHHGGVASWL